MSTHTEAIDTITAAINHAVAAAHQRCYDAHLAAEAATRAANVEAIRLARTAFADRKNADRADANARAFGVYDQRSRAAHEVERVAVDAAFLKLEEELADLRLALTDGLQRVIRGACPVEGGSRVL